MSDATQTGTAPDQTGAADKTAQNNDKTDDKAPQPQADDVKSLQAQKEHWREKAEANAARLAELEAEKAKEKETELKEKEQWKELAEQKDAELNQYKSKAQELEEARKQDRITQALTNELIKHSPLSLEDAIKLADLSGVTIGDDGVVTGLETVVQSLVEQKGFLFGKRSVNQGAGTPPATGAGAEKRNWTTAEVAAMSIEEYAANKQEIMAAKAEGRLT